MILSENTALRNAYFFRVWVSKSKGESTGEGYLGDILWEVSILSGGLFSFCGRGRDGFGCWHYFLLAHVPSQNPPTALLGATVICTLAHVSGWSLEKMGNSEKPE